jgi:hypothetical protein
MTLTQFKDCLDRLGCEPDAWPAPLNQSAHTLLAHSAQAAAALSQARMLDALLRTGDPAGQLGQDSILRVMNSVMAQLPPRAPIAAAPPRRGLRALLERLGAVLQTGAEWGPRLAACTAIALVMGIGAGLLIPTETTIPRSAGAALAAASTLYPVNMQ